MKTSNIIGGTLTILIAALFFYQTYSFPHSSIQLTGPEFMPRVYCMIMIILGVILIISSIKQGEDIEEKQSMIYSIIAMAITGVYVFMIPISGFYLTTAVLLIVLLLFAKVRSIVTLLSVPAGVLLFIFFFFERMLNVNVPLGSLFS